MKYWISYKFANNVNYVIFIVQNMILKILIYLYSLFKSIFISIWEPIALICLRIRFLSYKKDFQKQLWMSQDFPLSEYMHIFFFFQIYSKGIWKHTYLSRFANKVMLIRSKGKSNEYYENFYNSITSSFVMSKSGIINVQTNFIQN